MKKLLAVAALAASVAVSASANAQVTTVLTIGSDVVPGSNAFGFNTTSSVALGTAPGLTSFIAYCFDDKRLAQSGSTYIALTFQQFVNNVGVTGSGGRAANWNQVDLQDLNSMAALITTYGPTGTTNNSIQQQIWNIGNGTTNGTYAGPDLSSGWMVLVDKNEWEQGYNANQRCGYQWKNYQWQWICSPKYEGSQSFLAQIPSGGIVTPEPSTYALMAAGLAAVSAVARRRRRTNV